MADIIALVLMCPGKRIDSSNFIGREEDTDGCLLLAPIIWIRGIREQKVKAGAPKERVGPAQLP